VRATGTLTLPARQFFSSVPSKNFHFHHRFVRLHGEQDVALATLSPSFLRHSTIALSSVICPNLGMIMGFAMAIHRIDFAAATIVVHVGKNAASRMCDCGAMPFLAPTRFTGHPDNQTASS